MWKDIVKWFGSWILATIGLCFAMIDNHVINNNIDIEHLCSKGDLLLVSVVMVAEPLIMLGLNKSKNRRGVIVMLTFLSIGVLLFSTYVYSLVHQLNLSLFSNTTITQGRIEAIQARINKLSFGGVGVAFVVGLSTVAHNYFSKENMYNTAKNNPLTFKP